MYALPAKRQRPPSVTQLDVNQRRTQVAKPNGLIQPAAAAPAATHFQPAFPVHAHQPAGPEAFHFQAQQAAAAALFQPAAFHFQAQQPAAHAAAHFQVQQPAAAYPFQAHQPAGPAAYSFQAHQPAAHAAAHFQPALPVHAQQPMGGGAFQAPSALPPSKGFHVPSEPTGDPLQRPGVSLETHQGDAMVTAPPEFVSTSPPGLQTPTPRRPSSSTSTLSGPSPTAQFGVFPFK